MDFGVIAPQNHTARRARKSMRAAAQLGACTLDAIMPACIPRLVKMKNLRTAHAAPRLDPALLPGDRSWYPR
jgi:hypothetical protein